MVSPLRHRAWVVGCLALVGFSASARAQAPPPQATIWTLAQVLEAAARAHPLVEQARARIAAAEGSRQTAGALPNPIATYFVENGRFPGQGPLPFDRETSIYGTLPIQPFFQRGPRIGEADADIRAARAGLTTVERTIALDAARAYYRLALAQAALDAVRANRADVEQMLTYLGARVAQGASPEGDLIRVQVERDRLDTDVTLADVEVLRARAELRPLVALDAALAELRVSNPSVPASIALPPLPEWSARATAARPELGEARARVEAATAALSVARSGVVKELGASFGLKRTGGTNGMVAGLGISVPVFDRNQGDIQRATGERLAAEQEVAWRERTIRAQVEGAYEATTRLLVQANALEGGFLGRAEQSRQIAIGAYREGAATLLQVLDTSRALTDARLTYSRALIAAHQGLFELGLASGDEPAAAARRLAGGRQ